jgi:ethanolamine utilization protein EutQ (cupin superfamily)
VVYGRMHVVMDDSSEGEAGPGDVIVIPPGHDAGTVDFSSQIAQFAKQ